MVLELLLLFGGEVHGVDGRGCPSLLLLLLLLPLLQLALLLLCMLLVSDRHAPLR